MIMSGMRPERGGAGSDNVGSGGMGSPGPDEHGPSLGSFKHGGKVRKTGLIKAHKGERVLNKKQERKFEKKEHSSHKKM